VSEGLLSSQVQQLTLIKKEEKTGTVSIQVMLKTGRTGLTRGKYTPVCLDCFESPVMPIKVSGGTAPFFCLRLQNPGKVQSAEHWIGKDLSRAADEVSFYEKQLELRNGSGGGLEHMLEFMFDYAGVLECPVEKDDGVRKQLLVMRNLRLETIRLYERCGGLVQVLLWLRIPSDSCHCRDHCNDVVRAHHVPPIHLGQRVVQQGRV
jgi:hypothetical protein